MRGTILRVAHDRAGLTCAGWEKMSIVLPRTCTPLSDVTHLAIKPIRETKVR
ncbi:MAG: hypothetical protein ABIK62_03520 [candidate division WOR-3 bacterium]